MISLSEDAPTYAVMIMVGIDLEGAVKCASNGVTHITYKYHARKRNEEL